MNKKYKCEKCSKERTAGVLFDLVKEDWIYHKYCKNCIRGEVKALFERLGRPDLIPDEPRNFPQYKQVLNVIQFNVECLLNTKMLNDPEFKRKTIENMKKAFPGMQIPGEAQ